MPGRDRWLRPLATLACGTALVMATASCGSVSSSTLADDPTSAPSAGSLTGVTQADCVRLLPDDAAQGLGVAGSPAAVLDAESCVLTAPSGGSVSLTVSPPTTEQVVALNRAASAQACTHLPDGGTSTIPTVDPAWLSAVAPSSCVTQAVPGSTSLDAITPAGARVSLTVLLPTASTTTAQLQAAIVSVLQRVDG